MVKGAAYVSLLRGFLDRGLKGVRLVVTDDHEGIKASVAGELPRVRWQRCVVHFERNVLSHVPASPTAEVAEDLKAIFKMRREKTALTLAEEFVERYGGRFSRRRFRSSRPAWATPWPTLATQDHTARIRATNMLERLFKEAKRQMRVAGVFPNETSASTLATEIALRSSEEWALKRYLTNGRHRGGGKTEPTIFETLTGGSVKLLNNQKR